MKSAVQEVTGITSDSREVQPGFIFVAIQGGSQDGRQFIDTAIQRGAILILGEDDTAHVPYIRIKDVRCALAALAAEFYGNPSLSLLIIGVTGTSGKTTTTYLLESILQAAGHHVGMIGTISFRFGAKVFPSTHTTPGPVELQRLLFQMKEEGCTAVVMEVSSHALKQKRVNSISFDGMIFTNLSPEHLDFHPDMEDYFQAKALLFSEVAKFSLGQGKVPVAAINEDDEYGRRLLTSVTLNSQGFHVGQNFRITPGGITGTINGITIQSPMTGHFNCSNIAGAVSLAQSLGITSQVIENGVRNLSGVPGRLEGVLNDFGIHVWVDYAHKPDALEKVLKTLGALRQGSRLITVFGCGGDRDRKKRPLMGKIAVESSDLVFITSDNPRTEDPSAIIDEILGGTAGHTNFVIEVDRKQAIFKAIQNAQSGDLVLIAGKGHEDYQILGTKKIHFDDREVAAEAFISRR
ncbi:MAG: UDP-N-acetylmuramoyl-L-alanyl-D-glutamate--2,6-diaminopimelate ligase [Bdellovibrionia bacterium]